MWVCFELGVFQSELVKSMGIKAKSRNNQPVLSTCLPWFSVLEFESQLTEDNMAVKDGFSLLLNLKLPALLSILYLV